MRPTFWKTGLVLKQRSHLQLGIYGRTDNKYSVGDYVVQFGHVPIGQQRQLPAESVESPFHARRRQTCLGVVIPAVFDHFAHGAEHLGTVEALLARYENSSLHGRREGLFTWGREVLWIFSWGGRRIFPGGPTVVKFHFAKSKLRENDICTQPATGKYEVSKSRGSCPPCYSLPMPTVICWKKTKELVCFPYATMSACSRRPAHARESAKLRRATFPAWGVSFRLSRCRNVALTSIRLKSIARIAVFVTTKRM